MLLLKKAAVIIAVLSAGVTGFAPLYHYSVQQQHHSSTRLQAASSGLDAKQLDFTMGYMNKHHSDVLEAFVTVFSEIGEEAARFNAFSGGSYTIQDAKLVDISSTDLTLEVTVQRRGAKEPSFKKVTIPLDADPIRQKARSFPTLSPVPDNDKSTGIDALVRKLNRLVWIVKEPSVTGKLIQLGAQLGGNGIGILKENMYLNQVPHNRYVRKYFYDLAAEAVLEAVVECSERKRSNRMKVTTMFPEMNPSMDSYRIGTLLELARTIAIRLAEENIRVRLCVQGSMGVGIFTAIPKQLNGVATLMQRMDWQSGEGEENEGMVGTYINFGEIGKEHVVNAGGVDGEGNKIEQDDVFILLCPQSMVGVDMSIIPYLQEMVEAAGDRPIILINPDLVDKVSAQGQQSVRGRKQRIEFAESFEPIFHFQNIYVSGTSYFPILGAISKLTPNEPWVAHQRRDRANDDGEVYVPVLSSEEKPTGEVIMETFER